MACKPLIASDGYDGLVLSCKEHGTSVPVLNKEGFQAYAVDVLQFIDMLREHREEFKEVEDGQADDDHPAGG